MHVFHSGCLRLQALRTHYEFGNACSCIEDVHHEYTLQASRGRHSAATPAFSLVEQAWRPWELLLISLGAHDGVVGGTCAAETL